MSPESPRYLVMAASFLSTGGGEPRRFDAGTIIDYDGPPNAAMAPLNAAAFVAFNEVHAQHVEPADRWRVTHRRNVAGLNSTHAAMVSDAKAKFGTAS